MNKSVKTLSLRGRAGYSLACLESMGLYYGATIYEGFSFLISSLWKFTEVDYHDLWYDQYADLFPDIIKAFASYNDYLVNINESCEEYKVSPSEFYALKDVYENIDSQFTDAIGAFDLIVSSDLYTAINLDGESVEGMIFILAVMQQNNIKLPDVNKFLPYSYSKNDKRGVPYIRSDVYPW